MSKNIIQYLPKRIKEIINNIDMEIGKEILEIRLRINQPLQVVSHLNNFFVDKNSNMTKNISNAYIVDKEEIEKAKLILTENSLYALERQLKQGFITIPGGHRVGFTGEVIIENNQIKTIKNINCLNYRITSEIIGAGNKLINKIYNFQNNYYFNTLIISPPFCGKTTLLRDLIRIISYGDSKLNIKGKTIGVVDERSEIAGAYNGIPQNDIGPRTDLLDNCPKAEGMMLLIRAMSPQVIAVDELGNKEDIKAVKEVLNAGVTLLTTIHGNNLSSIKNRQGVGELINNNSFQRYIILNNKNGIGTIDKVLNQKFKKVG